MNSFVTKFALHTVSPKSNHLAEYFTVKGILWPQQAWDTKSNDEV